MVDSQNGAATLKKVVAVLIVAIILEGAGCVWACVTVASFNHRLTNVTVLAGGAEDDAQTAESDAQDASDKADSVSNDVDDVTSRVENLENDVSDIKDRLDM